MRLLVNRICLTNDDVVGEPGEGAPTLDEAEVREALEKAGYSGEVWRPEGSKWVVLDESDEVEFGQMEEMATTMSVVLGCSAFVVSLYKGAGGLDFELAVIEDGAMRRHLSYDGGNGWTHVEGEVQPWEEPLFFEAEFSDFADLSGEELEAELEHEFGRDAPEFDAWANRRVVEGALKPRPRKFPERLPETLNLPSFWEQPPASSTGAGSTWLLLAVALVVVAILVYIVLAA